MYILIIMEMIYIDDPSLTEKIESFFLLEQYDHSFTGLSSLIRFNNSSFENP